MSDVTRILCAIDDGDPRAAQQLLPLVYDELRKLAAERMAREKPGQNKWCRFCFRRQGPDGCSAR